MNAVSVPFVDLERVHAPLREELDAAVAAVIQRGDFILGAAVDEFERDFAAYVGSDHAVGVNSGTAAIAIAIAAAGIGPGDEVIVPAHTFIASALGVVHAGATPVFCDVEETTGLIDLDSAAAVAGPRTAAVLPVHLYGQVCDMDAVARFAGDRGLAVIEDAAQAHGASWAGRRAGSVGLVSAFSFYPSKNLGAFGDGGAICTSDPAIAERARRLRHLGQLGKGDHLVSGFNERLDTIQAAVLRVKLPFLDAWNRTRVEAAELYRARLAESHRLLPVRAGADDIYHLFPIRLGDRDGVAERLAASGVGVGVHYSPAVHEQPPFAAAAHGQLTRAEAWAAGELSLPMFAGITEQEVDRVCEALAVAGGSQ
jgi:dTDP-4-amino-4,6-dideoxygalactose transaminase